MPYNCFEYFASTFLIRYQIRTVKGQDIITKNKQKEKKNERFVDTLEITTDIFLVM